MSVHTQCFGRFAFFALALLLLGSLAYPLCLPAAAADSEAVRKKILCHTCLVKIYKAQRKYPEAAAEYQTLLAFQPNDARLHFDYGQTLNQLQKLQPAAQQYRSAAKIDPSVPEYQAALGIVLLNLKDYNGAVTALTKACQMGGKFQSQLTIAQQYQAQNEQLKQYTKQVQQKKEDEDD